MHGPSNYSNALKPQRNHLAQINSRYLISLDSIYKSTNCNKNISVSNGPTFWVSKNKIQFII